MRLSVLIILLSVKSIYSQTENIRCMAEVPTLNNPDNSRFSTCNHTFETYDDQIGSTCDNQCEIMGDILHIPVTITLIDNFNDDLVISESEMIDIFNDAREYFLPANIDLYLGFNSVVTEIDNNLFNIILEQTTNSDIRDILRNSSYYIDGAINIFVLKHLFAPSADIGSNHNNYQLVQVTDLLMKSTTPNYNTLTVAHELGHILGLFHTFTDSFGNGISACETDGIGDTTFDPYNNGVVGGSIDGNCTWVNGQNNDHNPPINNIMSYYYTIGDICTFKFTPCQITKMYEVTNNCKTTFSNNNLCEQDINEPNNSLANSTVRDFIDDVQFQDIGNIGELIDIDVYKLNFLKPGILFVSMSDLVENLNIYILAYTKGTTEIPQSIEESINSGLANEYLEISICNTSAFDYYLLVKGNNIESCVNYTLEYFWVDELGLCPQNFTSKTVNQLKNTSSCFNCSEFNFSVDTPASIFDGSTYSLSAHLSSDDTNQYYNVYAVNINTRELEGTTAPNVLAKSSQSGAPNINLTGMGCAESIILRAEHVDDPYGCFHEIQISIPVCTDNNKTISVAWPQNQNGCYEWGTTHSINWTATTNIQSVNIKYCQLGTACNNIASNYPNNGNFTWTVPNHNGDFFIKITDSDNYLITDDSYYFSIDNTCNEDDCQPAQIELTSPLNNMSVAVGDQVIFSWDADFNDACQIKKYHLQYSGDSTFTNQYTVNAQSLVRSYGPLEVTGEGTIYWRVRTENDIGHFGAWTNKRKFYMYESSPFNSRLYLVGEVLNQSPICENEYGGFSATIKNNNSFSWSGDLVCLIWESDNTSNSQLIERIYNVTLNPYEQSTFSFYDDIILSNAEKVFIGFGESQNGESEPLLREDNTIFTLEVPYESCNSEDYLWSYGVTSSNNTANPDYLPVNIKNNFTSDDQIFVNFELSNIYIGGTYFAEVFNPDGLLYTTFDWNIDQPATSYLWYRGYGTFYASGKGNWRIDYYYNPNNSTKTFLESSYFMILNNCDMPISITGHLYSNNNFSISWSKLNNLHSHRIEWREIGGSWQGVSISGINNNYEIQNLTPGNTYDWRIRRNCFGDNISFWSDIGQVYIPKSCSDGLQNGDETGIDCGGASCQPCECEQEYYVADYIHLEDENIHVRQEIIGTNIVSDNLIISYKAGTAITMDVGFEVLEGAIFNAHIEECEQP